MGTVVNTTIKPVTELTLAESIARRMSATTDGLDALEWLIAAILIKQFSENTAPCKNGKMPHNVSKNIIRGER